MKQGRAKWEGVNRQEVEKAWRRTEASEARARCVDFPWVALKGVKPHERAHESQGLCGRVSSANSAGDLISREDEAYERSWVDGRHVNTSRAGLKKTAKVAEGASNQ